MIHLQTTRLTGSLRCGAFVLSKLNFLRRCILLPALLALLLLFSGCSSSDSPAKDSDSPQTVSDENVLTVLCADFPEYDWTCNLAGNPQEQAGAKKVVVKLLNKSGADMHSYQPTIADMVQIADCDLLIYNGGASQFWIEDALEASPNPDRQVLSLMELFETEPERFPSYTQEHDHDHDHEHEHDHDHGHEHAHAQELDHPQEHGQDAQEAQDSHGSHTSHEEETDEHLWLSLRMAEEFCRAIASRLGSLNPAADAIYQDNAKAYIQKLSALDRKFTDLTLQLQDTCLLFADRFPFKYFCDDYGLQHEAAFPGCSAETEASFETIVSLADDLKTLPRSRLVILDGGSASLAGAIRRAADLPREPVETLYSMQSLPQTIRALKEAGRIQNENQVTYLFLMEENYDTLARILSEQK